MRQLNCALIDGHLLQANLAMQSETGRVGAMLMELITGKVILMMLMVLVVSALLTVVADPYQKEQVRPPPPLINRACTHWAVQDPSF